MKLDKICENCIKNNEKLDACGCHSTNNRMLRSPINLRLKLATPGVTELPLTFRFEIAMCF